MKYLGETSLKKLISLVKGDIAAKQNKITEVGILKGRGDGTVSATSPLILNSGTDYGDTLPSSPATNQLFFQTVGSNFILDNVYPVGSIYMNVNSTNPGTFFGGTWEQIQGRFLLGMSSSYPAGSQGGEATHTLTVDEMPAHSHAIYSGWGDIAGNVNDAYRYHTWASNDRGWKTGTLGTNSIGGGKSHNNMPPYLSVYIWKRTA